MNIERGNIIQNRISSTISKIRETSKHLFLKKHFNFSSNTKVNISSTWDEYIASEDVRGIFLSQNKLEVLLLEIQKRGLTIVPSYPELIAAAEDQIYELLDCFNIENIRQRYNEEDKPKISFSDLNISNLGENDNCDLDSINDIDIGAALLGIIKNVEKDLINTLSNNVPIFSDRNYKEVFVYKKQSGQTNIIPEINVTLFHNTISKVISIEGPQGAGKSTQVGLIKKYFLDKNIPISETLSKDQDPSRLVVTWENSNNAFMPFLERQYLTRKSLEARYNYVKDKESISILDRSIYTAILLYCKMTRLEDITQKEKKIDIQNITEWLSKIKKDYNSQIIILMNKDIIQQFFRMRKDTNSANQKSDFISQILENIFYKTLIRLGIGIEIQTNDLSIDKATNKIFNTINFQGKL